MQTCSRFAARVLVPVGCLACIVAVITGCDMTVDSEAGRSVPTAWEAGNGSLLGVDVVYEFENDRGLKVAHLTVDESSFAEGVLGGFFGGATSGPQPPPDGAFDTRPGMPVPQPTRFAPVADPNREGFENE